MKKRPFNSKMSKNSKKLTMALVLAVSISVPVHALEGEVTFVEHDTIIPGFVYSNRVANTSGGRIESFTLSLDPSSTAYPIAVQGSGSVYSGGNIEKAISYAEDLGYNVVGAINSDYFSFSTGVPFGIVIEDGIYKSSPSEYSSILFNGSQTTILGGYLTVPIGIMNQRIGEYVTVLNFNKYRAETGGLYLMNSDFSTTTRTTTDGVMVRMVPTYEALASENGGKLTVDTTMTLTVVEVARTDGAWDIGENDYILTAGANSGYLELLLDYQIGDQINLTVSTDNYALQQAQWATGGGDIMIDDGILTNTNGWEHIAEGDAPRTAFGLKADGTMVFYAVDGRQSDYSVGLTQTEVAYHLLEEGCVMAVNLDGGGSTSFAVSSTDVPNVLPTAEVVNSPSEGYLRNCATFMLLVDPQVPYTLTLMSEAETVLIGSHMSLGRSEVRDVNGTILGIYPTDGTLESLSNLGYIGSHVDYEGYAVYDYSPLEPGIEEFYITGNGLSGRHELNVVNTLTSLEIMDTAMNSPITEVQVMPYETLSLGYRGNLNGGDVYANGGALSWSVVAAEGVESNEKIGSVDGSGVFTAGEEDCIIELKAGGLTTRVAVTVKTDFSDVPLEHWAYESITYLKNNGLVSGISETEYGMGYEIRRGDFVLMLYGALGSPEVTAYANFSDVSAEDYYYTAISWASGAGVVTGLGDGSFGAQSSITREQAMVILFKAYQTVGKDLPIASLSNLAAYTDQGDVSDYALRAVSALLSQGVVGDISTTIYPKIPLARESMALYLYDLFHYVEKETIAPTQFAVHPNEIYLLPGADYTLLPMLDPVGSSAVITWSSSDPSAVSVDSNGKITNVFTGQGQPVVTVTGRTGSLSASCIVRCVPEGTEIPEVPSLNLGGTTTTTPSVTTPPEDTTTTTPEDTTTTTPDSGNTGALIETASTGFVIGTPGKLNVRTGAGSDYDVVAQVDEGEIVTLHGKTSSNWYQISYQYTNTETGASTTVQGYVMGEYVEEKVIVGTVVAEVGLNMRTGAGTAFDVIVKLPNGSQVAVLQMFDGWYKIQANINGTLTIGFVASDFLEIASNDIAVISG